jgi:hypothetical protein|mmetsp:Transcript_41062/g.53850  ORF Transcript_41062/g.53850 Transcript_41062/m.53850 type:complete len:147 (+) Transcript_41062:1321-1761(+)
MEKLTKSFDDSRSGLYGRSMNAMRVRELRSKALSQETLDSLQSNPYLEIWDVEYYSTSDEEDNDSEGGSNSEEDSEIDSAEKNGVEEKKGEEEEKGEEDTKAEEVSSEKPAAESTKDAAATESPEEDKKPKPVKGIRKPTKAKKEK